MPPGSKAPAGTWVGARVCGSCVCLAGSVHRAACHSRSGGERPGSGIKAPRSGLASQTSRCIKKSQRPLSPLSGQSTGRRGRRALPRTGGSDEAGAVALLVLSLPLLVFMPHLEKPSAGDLKKKKKNVCVEGGGRRACPGGVGGRGGRRGQVHSLPWCGFGFNGRRWCCGSPAEAPCHCSSVWAAAAPRLGFKPLH